MVPLSPMFEGVAQKVGSKLGGEAIQKAFQYLGPIMGEAEVWTVLNNMADKQINPDKSTWDQSGYWQQMATMAGLKAAAPRVSALDEVKPSNPEWQSGRQTFQNSEKSQFGLEDQLYALKNQALADKATALNVHSELSKFSPEAREEVYHWMEAKGAGLPTNDLSPEAQLLWDNPAFQSAIKTQGERYALAREQRGDTAVEPNPYFVHRVVTEGVEPSNAGLGGGVKTNASSLKGRRFAAVTDESGNRQLVEVNDNGKLFSPSGEEVYIIVTGKQIGRAHV